MQRIACSLVWVGVLSAGLSDAHDASAGVTTTGQLLPQRPDGNNYHAGGLLVVGDDAPGQLTASAGGNVTAAGVVLGRQATGDGDILLTGGGTTLDTTGDLVIGDAGAGRLRVFDAARVTTGAAADLLLGGAMGGRGLLDLNGAGRIDVGAQLIANQFGPGATSGAGGGGAMITIDNASRLRVGTVVPTADAWLNRDGTHPLLLLAAGSGSRLDVTGTLHLAGSAPATIEAYDDTHLQLGALALGVGSHGTLVLDRATAAAHTLHLGVNPTGRGTLDLLGDARLNVDAGGVRFGIDGVATADLHGELSSIGRIEINATSPSGNRVTLHGPDARLHTFAWLTVGNPDPGSGGSSDRATLRLNGGSVDAGGFLTVERTGALAGHGRITLGDALTVTGTVATAPANVIEVVAVNPARFLGGTLDATWDVELAEPEPGSNLTPDPVVTHGILRFDSDARLDGTLVLHRRQPTQHPELLPGVYEPWTLIDTADDTHDLISTFDEVAGLGIDAATAWAVTYSDHAVQAQRALRGDATLDRIVNQSDLDTVLGNWGDPRATWTDGDMTGNGTIDQGDLDAVLMHWGAASAPIPADWTRTPLPEPAAAAVLLIGIQRRRPTRRGPQTRGRRFPQGRLAAAHPCGTLRDSHLGV